MKYIILVPDGMADEPIVELGGQTPLEAAHTPNMDFLAQKGLSALVQTIPEGMAPGSDIGNLALMGYDPRVNFSGRAPLEAANLGVKLDDDEVAFRCNLITEEDGIMVDYSAGHIPSDEAKLLIEYLARAIDWPDVRFYPGKSYRHLMVMKTLNVEQMLKVKTVPPHDILNQPLKNYLPGGPQSTILLNLMEKSRGILSGHQVNTVRLDMEEKPANMIWLWGQGSRPQLPLFKDRYSLSGCVISAVDLVNGIGCLVGFEVISVPGANGYYDTNYKGKAEYALESLKKHDFVYVHVESPDEAGHNGDCKAKVECIERFDKFVVGTVRTYLKSHPQVRLLVAPDHPTPIVRRTHTSSPVPFVMVGPGIEPNGTKAYSEKAADQKGLKFHSGEEMMRYFLKAS
ncbi:MAG: cofactor-independent phosphoglycerate mutase [Candidatus Omnitrophica bacterium]|nr:cofactor-independent phosphoglycerate mutase [Candidatus Omnitrophota bacterium]